MNVENWFMYFCMRENTVDSVVVNLSHDKSDYSLPWLTIISHSMLQASNGFASVAESEILDQIQNGMEEMLNETKPGFLKRVFAREKTSRFKFVGRRTGAGSRDLYYYGATAISEPVCEIFFSRFASYKFEVTRIIDPKWSRYFNLHPRRALRALILSDAQIESRKKDGEDIFAERIVDHTLYFPSKDARKKFIEDVSLENWGVQSADESDPINDSHHYVTLQRTHCVTKMWSDIHIIALASRAEQYGGTYEGWGSFVMK